MPFLKLQYGNKILGEYAIAYGKPLTIGRKDNNDIVIGNLAVSGRHARIDFNDKGVIVTDLDSKNGTFVNGKTFPKCLLSDGDEIVVGKHKLIFSETEGGKTLPPKQNAVKPMDSSSMEETMVLDTTSHRNMISNILSGNRSEKTRKKLPPGVLVFLKGGTGRVAIKNKFTRIGKDPENEVVIKGLFAGKRASTISIRPDGLYLNHVEGFFKTRVNGKKIKTAVKLSHGDTIDVGSAKLRFLCKVKKKKEPGGDKKAK